MNVYFARSLRGEHSENEKITHQWIVSTIKACGHHPQFEIAVSTKRQNRFSDEYIHQRDLEWLRACHVMIADVSNASHGVGYEIAYAKYVRSIPILMVCRADAGPVSAMLTGWSAIANYQTLEQLQQIITTFLTAVEIKEQYP